MCSALHVKTVVVIIVPHELFGNHVDNSAGIGWFHYDGPGDAAKLDGSAYMMRDASLEQQRECRAPHCMSASVPTQAGKRIKFQDQCKGLARSRGNESGFSQYHALFQRSSLSKLDQAFRRFFERVNRGEKAGFSRFGGRKCVTLSSGAIYGRCTRLMQKLQKFLAWKKTGLSNRNRTGCMLAKALESRCGNNAGAWKDGSHNRFVESLHRAENSLDQSRHITPKNSVGCARIMDHERMLAEFFTGEGAP